MTQTESDVMRFWILTFWVLGVSNACAGESSVLKGSDIISALSGKTVRGAYADGTAFTETFWADGKDTYWDPRGTSLGKWSVARDLMCFEYDVQYEMSGGCFRVEKSGSNCFDFYSVSKNVSDVPPAGTKPRYVARASADGAVATCPVELQV
jgi:hypothetical protein